MQQEKAICIQCMEHGRLEYRARSCHNTKERSKQPSLCNIRTESEKSQELQKKETKVCLVRCLLASHVLLCSLFVAGN